MANLQRFQVLSAARQDLFLPDCPVWVSRYQLSRDTQSGKRLLQTRMVNCSEKTVQQVFLRIVCLDARRERLRQLDMVPMQAQRVLSGRVFGDDKLVELPVEGAVFAEVYAQRVRFTDGSAWDENGTDRYLAFSAPEPVRAEDEHYEALSSRALSGGVRNDFYFRAQQGLWLCTCGLPNGTRTLRCPRCGASRVWLEQHMDRNLLEAPARPRPEPASVQAAPVYQAAPVVPAPAPSREEYYPPAQPTIILQSPPEPEPEEASASHAGRITAIVMAVLLFLGLGGYCAYRFLTPYLQYQKALQAQAAGNYEQAVELFEGLGDYKDSLDQIDETMLQKALHLMAEGNYQQALDLFETLENTDNYKADCLYALGVLAYNDKDPDKAMTYVAKLEERFPDYEKTAELRSYCAYSLGNRTAAQADEETDIPMQMSLWQEAMDWFTKAGAYSDSAERVTSCRYHIALLQREQGQLLEAIDSFAALAGYQDADAYRRDCMLSYAKQHIENTDERTVQFLTELADFGSQEAQSLLDRLNGKGFSFHITLGPTDNSGRVQQVTDLSEIYIQYQVEQSDENGAVLVLVLYSLPDGREGRALLNNDHSSKGARGWAAIPFPTNCAKSGPVTLTFYDSMRGENVEPLAVLTFDYTMPDKEPDKEPDKDSDKNNGKTIGG